MNSQRMDGPAQNKGKQLWAKESEGFSFCCIMTNLIQDSKTEIKFVYRQAFTMSMLTKLLQIGRISTLTNIGAKIWWINLMPMWMSGGRHPWEDHTCQYSRGLS